MGKKKDAKLTENGLRQSVDARLAWASPLFEDGNANEADLVIVSPLRRAVQTAAGLAGKLDDLTSDGGSEKTWKRFRIVELCSEARFAPADSGIDRKTLLREFPGLIHWQNFDKLRDDWCAKENYCSLQHRVTMFREFLRNQPEQRIVVVGHSAFFAYLT